MAWGPSGRAARSQGSPGPAAPPDPSAAPSCQQRDKPTHARPHGPAADTHDATAHGHTHTYTRTRVCMHKLITFPSPQRLLRPCRSLVPLSEHPSSPLASAERQQRQEKRWTRAGSSACRTARVSDLSPAPVAFPAASAEKREKPQRDRGEDHEPPLQHNSPAPRGWCRRGPAAGEEAVKL